MTIYYVRTDGDNGNFGTANSAAGAWADPGYALATISGGDHVVYLQAGTYTLTTSTPGAGGPIVFPTDLACSLIGFEVDPDDGCPTGNKPIIDVGSVNTINIISMNGAEGETQIAANIELRGNENTSVRGIDGTNDLYDFVVNCVAIGCPFITFRNLTLTSCYAETTNTTNAITNICNCRFVHTKGGNSGFSNAAKTHMFCISENAAGDAYNDAGGFRIAYVNCVAYNPGAAGFTFRNLASTSGGLAINCLSVDATTYGFEAHVVAGAGLISCAEYNSTTTRKDGNFAFDLNPITLTADPFADAANGDFSLNFANGGGMLCRRKGIGIPGQLYPTDLGAVMTFDRRSTSGFDALMMGAGFLQR